MIFMKRIAITLLVLLSACDAELEQEIELSVQLDDDSVAPPPATHLAPIARSCIAIVNVECTHFEACNNEGDCVEFWQGITTCGECVGPNCHCVDDPEATCTVVWDPFNPDSPTPMESGTYCGS